jgi:ATP-dependent exoDNAse (exonuclease V) beta subunit
MTVHAAKGLEFPIVFVVNLHGGGRGRPAGFSVIERGPSGEPEVCFGTNAATQLEEAREAEELRRLFYVAVTRARDRLYLAAEVDKTGTMRRHPRSLASLLPASLAALFGAAATGAAEAEWETRHGTFAFRICRPSTAVVTLEASPRAPATDAAPDVLAPLLAIPAAGLAVAAATARIPRLDRAETRGPGPARDPAADRLLGTAVHRLFQRGVDADAARDAALLDLLSTEERVDVPDASALLIEAFERYRAARLQPEIDALLASGSCFYEVPFSFVPAVGDRVCIRGVIDCLVIAPDGRATVLEFKTGAPQPEHQAQAALYQQALEATGTFEQVAVRLCYA